MDLNNDISLLKMHLILIFFLLFNDKNAPVQFVYIKNALTPLIYQIILEDLFFLFFLHLSKVTKNKANMGLKADYFSTGYKLSCALAINNFRHVQLDIKNTFPGKSGNLRILKSKS